MPLRRYADFSGRSRRMEYWMFYLFLLLVSGAIFFGSMMIGDALGLPGKPMADRPSDWAMYTVYALFAFWAAMLIPYLAVLVRRLHDSDKSGLWLLIYFVPFGGIVLFVFTVIDGTSGPNRFGEDPKQEEYHTEIFA